AERVVEIDEGQIVGRDSQPEDRRRPLAAFALVLRERDETFERLERADGSALLPAPVLPFGVAHAREQPISTCDWHRGAARCRTPCAPSTPGRALDARD